MLRKLSLTAVIFTALFTAGQTAQAAKPKHNHYFSNALKIKVGLRYFGSIPMKNTHWALEAAGRRYNVNPALIVGIAAKETQLGRTSCLRYEAWGLGACGRAWTPPSFNSWRESIFYFARFLRTRFLNRGINTVEGILSAGYCVGGCGSWASDVYRWMGPLHLGFQVTYPYSKELRKS